MKKKVILIIFLFAFNIFSEGLPSGALDGVADLPESVKAPDSSNGSTNIDYNRYYDAARRASRSENSSTTIKTLGTILFLSGLTSVILTIADANKSENMQVDTKTKITIKNQWSPIHTALTIMGGGMVIGGAFTWTF